MIVCFGSFGLIVVDLSLEFLMGRALDNAMLNVDQKDVAESMYTSSYLKSIFKGFN